jgi:hypothetical protein
LSASPGLATKVFITKSVEKRAKEPASCGSLCIRRVFQRQLNSGNFVNIAGI